MCPTKTPHTNSPKVFDKLSRILSIIALFVAIIFPSITFYCTRMDIAATKEVRFDISAKMNWKKFRIDSWQNNCRLVQGLNQYNSQYYSGLSLFVEVSLKNLGPIPVNIEEITTYQLMSADSTSNTSKSVHSITSNCFKSDYETHQDFPQTVGPYTSCKILVLTPWCITDSVYEQLRRLKPSTTYSSLDLNELYSDAWGNYRWLGTNGFQEGLGSFFRHELYPGVMDNSGEYLIVVDVILSEGGTQTCIINLSSEFGDNE